MSFLKSWFADRPASPAPDPALDPAPAPESVANKLAPLLKGRARSAVRRGLIETAESSSLIILELLDRAPLRLEELARRFVVGIGAFIAGETLEASRAALARLDYNRLLAEAERAKRATMDPTGKGSHG